MKSMTLLFVGHRPNCKMNDFIVYYSKNKKPSGLID